MISQVCAEFFNKMLNHKGAVTGVDVEGGLFGLGYTCNVVSVRLVDRG